MSIWLSLNVSLLTVVDLSLTFSALVPVEKKKYPITVTLPRIASFYKKNTA